MVIAEKTRRALEDLGLTAYEIKACVSLIDFGLMTAAEISKQSGVPYSKIYDVLNSLESKGWIQADRSRPSRFYPKSPSTAIETMRLKLETERRRSEEQVLGELAPLYEKRGVKERPEIWIVRGQFNILSKAKEMLTDCREELLIAIPAIVANLTELLLPPLAALRERGVKVRLMTSEDAIDRGLERLAEWADVRIRGQMFGGGIISDAREVMLLLGEEAEGSSQLAIWADHVGLAKFAKDYFAYLWDESKIFAKVRST